MIGFVQRYQKVFVFVVAFLITLSFIFFGLLPKGGMQMEDPVVYKTRSGQKVKRSKYEGIKTLINTNNGESLIYGKVLGNHFFTENFFVSDLVRPGLLGPIVDKHYVSLKAELQKHHDREKRFQPYEHPEAAFVSAQSVWNLHAPKMSEQLEALKQASHPKQAFELREQIFLSEAQFDSFSLWKLLSEQEDQLSWLPKDQQLTPENLHLFGYKTLSDWFGEALLSKATEMILEAKELAKKHGYHVSNQEAEQDLLKLNEMNYQRLKSIGIKDFDSSKEYFDAKLNQLGLHKTQMVQLWKDLLTFRRFLQESGKSVLVDSSTLEPFESYAEQRAFLAKYELPRELKMKSLEELYQFESYLYALGKPLDQLSLKFEPKPLSEIAEKHPQLVESPIHLSFKEVSKTQCAKKVRLKEIWNYKLDPKNAQTLSKQFPTLKLESSMSPEQLQAAFDSLDPSTQALLDQWVRMQLLEQSEDWLAKNFEEAQLYEGQFFVRNNGQGLPFKGFDQVQDKKAYFSKWFNEEKSLDFTPFTFDQINYYQVFEIKKTGEDQLVSYGRIKEDRTLEKLLYLTLKEAHKDQFTVDPKIRQSIKVASSTFFEPLKKAIRNDYLSVHKEPKEGFNDEFYVKNRFLKPMREALEYLKAHKKDQEAYCFNALWKMPRVEQTAIRYLSDPTSMEAFMQIKPGHWSDVKQLEDQLEFYQVINHSPKSNQHLMQKQIKKNLEKEMKKTVIIQLMDSLDSPS